MPPAQLQCNWQAIGSTVGGIRARICPSPHKGCRALGQADHLPASIRHKPSRVPSIPVAELALCGRVNCRVGVVQPMQELFHAVVCSRPFWSRGEPP